MIASVFDGFFEVVAKILATFYDWTGSYGGSIIILTIVVMTLTAPLTLKSTKSMLQMTRLQPEMKAIQTKHKDDREKLNQELMAFYKENEINPLSGCVPVLLQAPVFLILYQVLRGLTQRAGGHASGLGQLVGELKSNVEPSSWRFNDHVFKPVHLEGARTSELYQSLISTNRMNFFGVDLSLSPSQAFKIGVVTAIPFGILIIGMVLVQWIQNRQIQGRSSGAAMNPTQQMLMKVLPFSLPLFSIGFPAGLGLYYFVQGLCRMGLNQYITHKVYAPHKEALSQVEVTTADPAVDPDSTAKPSKSSKSSKPDPKTLGDASLPKTVKAQALERKAQGGSSQMAIGRKSGAPRSGSGRRSGT